MASSKFAIDADRLYRIALANPNCEWAASLAEVGAAVSPNPLLMAARTQRGGTRPTPSPAKPPAKAPRDSRALALALAAQTFRPLAPPCTQAPAAQATCDRDPDDAGEASL